VEALTARADKDRYIILALTDDGFIDMAMNFYYVSIRQHQLDNFLFVGLGSKTCETLKKMSMPCFYYADDRSASTSSDIGSHEFNRKVNIRTGMIIRALVANFTVINSDVDVAFLHNPVHQLKVISRLVLAMDSAMLVS